MPNVNIVGHGTFWFPDNMSKDEIRRSMNEKLRQEEVARESSSPVRDFVVGAARGAGSTLTSGVAGLARLVEAEDFAKWVEKNEPLPAPTSTAGQIGSALGSTGTYLGTGVLTGGLGAAALGVGGGYDEARRRIEQAKFEGREVDPDSEFWAKTIGGAAGTLEALPVGRLAGGFTKRLGLEALEQQATRGGVRGLATAMGLQAASEAPQEAVTAVAQNVGERLYRPEQEILEGVGEAALMGGGVGALFGAGGHGLGRLQRRRASAGTGEVGGEGEPPPPDSLGGIDDFVRERPVTTDVPPTSPQDATVAPVTRAAPVYPELPDTLPPPPEPVQSVAPQPQPETAPVAAEAVTPAVPQTVEPNERNEVIKDPLEVLRERIRTGLEGTIGQMGLERKVDTDLVSELTKATPAAPHAAVAKVGLEAFAPDAMPQLQHLRLWEGINADVVNWMRSSNVFNPVEYKQLVREARTRNKIAEAAKQYPTLDAGQQEAQGIADLFRDRAVGQPLTKPADVLYNRGLSVLESIGTQLRSEGVTDPATLRQSKPPITTERPKPPITPVAPEREVAGAVPVPKPVGGLTVEKQQSLLAELDKRLSGMNMRDKVGLHVLDMITTPGGGQAEGRYVRGQKLIELAANTPGADVATLAAQLKSVLNHEVVHPLRELGLFKSNEWKTVARDAKKRGHLAEAEKLYGQQEGYTAEMIEEESVANLFRDVTDGVQLPKSSQKSYQKFITFLDRTGNALRGAGFQTASDVFARIESGEVGGRTVAADPVTSTTVPGVPTAAVPNVPTAAVPQKPLPTTPKAQGLQVGDVVDTGQGGIGKVVNVTPLSVRTGKPLDGYFHMERDGELYLRKNEEIVQPNPNKARIEDTKGGLRDLEDNREFLSASEYESQKKQLEYELKQLTESAKAPMKLGAWIEKEKAAGREMFSLPRGAQTATEQHGIDPSKPRTLADRILAAARVQRGGGQIDESIFPNPEDRAQVARLAEDKNLDLDRMANVDPDEYFNFEKLGISDQAKDHLRNQVRMRVTTSGMDPKQVVSRAQIESLAKELLGQKGLVELDKHTIDSSRMRQVAFLAGRQQVLGINAEIMRRQKELDANRGSLSKEQLQQADDEIRVLENDAQTIFNKLIPMRSEDGRSLAYHKIMARSSFDEVYWQSRIKRMLNLPAEANLPETITGPLNVALREGQAAQAELAEAEQTGDQEKVAKAKKRVADATEAASTEIQKHKNNTWPEAILGLWKAGLLTGPKTLIANIGSNVTHQAMREVARLPASWVDAALASSVGQKAFGTTGQRTILAPGTGGAATGAKRGKEEFIRAGGQAIRGAAVSDQTTQSQLDARRTYNIPSNSKVARALEKYVNFVFGVQDTTDRPFREMARAREMFQAAKLKAMEEQRTGALARGATALDERTAALLASPTDEMKARGEAASQEAVFANDNWMSEGWKALKRGAENMGPEGQAMSKGLDFIVPFVKVPSNVFRQMLQYSPVGVGAASANIIAKGMVRRSLGPGEQRIYAELLGRGLVGSALMFLGYQAAKAGLMTGMRDKEDAAGRTTDEALGRPQGGLKVGDKWIQINRLSPGGNLMVTGASMFREGERFLKNPEQRAGNVIAAITKNVKEMPFMQGAENLIGAVENPESRGTQYLQRQIGTIVPTIVGNVAQVMDPKARQVYDQGLAASLKQRTPFLRETLPVRQDQFGRELTEPGLGPAGPMFDIFRTTTQRTDPLAKEMIANDYTFGRLQQKKTQGETSDTYRLREQLAGILYEQHLNKIIGTSKYAKADVGEERRELLGQAKEDAGQKLSKMTARNPRYKKADEAQKQALLQQYLQRAGGR